MLTEKNLSAAQIENVVDGVRHGIRHLPNMRPTPALKCRAVIAGSLNVLEQLGLVGRGECLELGEQADAAYEEGKKAWKARREG
jgi:hypothetical protein